MAKLGILGGGALGRQLVHLARQVEGFEPVAVYDDTLEIGATIEDVPVVGPIDRALDDHRAGRDGRAIDAALLAVGYRHPHAREEIFERLQRAGLPFATLVHPTCWVDRSARLGEGCILYPGCVVDQGVRLEENVLLNLGSIVAHDGRIGAHGFVAPGVKLAGEVTVGRRAFLGVGTVVVDGVRLGDDSRTAAGAVVVRDDPGGALLVGVPARRRERATSLRK